MNKGAGIWIGIGCGLAFASLPADTVTLRSGEVLQGKVLKESPEAIVMEYRFSSTIMDERTISRSDILKVERELADTKEFQEIQKIESPATVLDASWYDQMIQGKLVPFLKSYSYSANTPAVREKIAFFEERKKRLADGKLKVNGRWLTAEEAVVESYQLDAYRAYEAMRADLESNRLIGGLNAFGVFEQKWPFSATYPDAVNLTRETLQKLDQFLTHQLRNYPFQEEQRKLSLERAPIEQRSQVEAAQLRDIEAAKAAIAASKTAGKFPQYSPLIKSSMEELQNALRAESKRLDAIDLKPLQKGVNEARLAASQIEQKQLALAETSLKNAETAWPKLESLPRLKAYLETVRAAALAGSEAQAKAVENAADLKKQETGK